MRRDSGSKISAAANPQANLEQERTAVMKVVGIVAEYNPFHSGHAYHLQEAKRRTGADFAVVVMSPDFVQRGEPAVSDKYARTKMALLNGADLVLELPVCYAAGSAEYFAQGAVSVLDGLGVVDVLSFGCEDTGYENSGRSTKWDTGAKAGRKDNFKENQKTDPEKTDSGLFWEIAGILNAEPETFRKSLRARLACGLSFPKAREAALLEYLESREDPFLSQILPEHFLEKPNNILAVEYCRAILRLQSSMEILPVARTGGGYHEEQMNGRFCSAAALRKAVLSGESSSIWQYIPENLYGIYEEVLAHPLTADDFRPVLMQQLLTAKSFDHIQDISADLSDRICNLRFRCIGKTYEELVEFLAAKQLTKARIRRALLHLILGIGADQTERFRQNGCVYYARMLGFRRDASPLLHEIKKNSSLPLLSKNADAAHHLDPIEREMLSRDFEASHLYRGIRTLKYGTPFRSEYEMSPVVI